MQSGRATTSDPVFIVETTLRDGGYEIDHQLTADDTAILTAALDRAGFSYIEIGHGNGVGSEDWASTKLAALHAAATDADHLAAARAMSLRAKYGVLIIVGKEFTPVSIVDRIAKSGIHFARLGLPPDLFLDRAAWLPYVDRLKEVGLLASINLMQTSVLSVRQVAEGAAVAAEHGADWFYVVDSFGGMTPTDVTAYTRALRESTNLVIGLHAHNNSGLAVANALAAMEAGARLVDTTLQGIGRATGNPATEVMVLALQKRGYELGIDTESTMQLGELARSLIAEKGNDPLYFVTGTARIHSRALNELRRTATREGRPLRPFLLRLGEEADQRAVDARDAFHEDVVRAALETTPRPAPSPIATTLVDRLAATCARESVPALAAQAEAVFVQGIRRRRTSVLHLVAAARSPFDGALTWETAALTGVSLPIGTEALAPLTQRVPQVVVIDTALASRADLPKGSEHTLHADFAQLTASAAASLAAALAAEAPVVVPDDKRLEAVVVALRARGRDVVSASTAPSRVIVTAGSDALQLRAGDRVITLDVSAARASFVDRARAAGATVLLPPIAAHVAAWVAGELGALDAAKCATESSAIGASRVVEPHMAPGSGELVVDCKDAPRRVVDHHGAAPPFEELAKLRAAALLGGKSNL